MNRLYKQKVIIPQNGIELEGELSAPNDAGALVIFSHGSGSSRFSPRNNYVAGQLQYHGIVTFLFDLLTEEEDELYSNRFNIDLLTERLVHTTNWLSRLPMVKDLPIGYFGASTGAASALAAAAALPETIQAVVSRGGRPDLVSDKLPSVRADTLLIVGELDTEVIHMNKESLDKLTSTKALKIVGGASHLFEEAGALEKVSELALKWFDDHLAVKVAENRKDYR